MWLEANCEPSFLQEVGDSSSSDDVLVLSAAKHAFEYSLKMVNPSCMRDFKTVDIRGQKLCSSLDELKEFIMSRLPSGIGDVPDLEAVDMGFVEPGHGGKGRKVWLFNDDDLHNMYKTHQKKKRILLWCYTEKAASSHASRSTGPEKKGKGDNEGISKGGSSYNSQLQKQEAVDKIFSQLKDKHSGKYKPEQLRTWAHMYHLGTHDSLECPPDKPFFRGNLRKRSSSEIGSSSSSSDRTPESKRSAGTTANGVSPRRQVNIRSELTDQLKKCQDLVETGGISKEVFDDLQHTILDDIKQL